MTAPSLNSFAGATAPPGLGDELAGFAALTPAAQARFWDLLEPNLANEVSDRVEALVEQFCVDTGVTAPQLVPAPSSATHTPPDARSPKRVTLMKRQKEITVCIFMLLLGNCVSKKRIPAHPADRDGEGQASRVHAASGCRRPRQSADR